MENEGVKESKGAHTMIPRLPLLHGMLLSLTADCLSAPTEIQYILREIGRINKVACVGYSI